MSDINLLQSKTELSPMLGTVLKYIKPISLGIVGIVCAFGIITVVLFYALDSQKTSLMQKKDAMLKAIQADVTKEGFLVLIHKNIGVLEKIMEVQKSFTPYIDVTQTIAGEIPISSFSFGESNTVNLALKFGSLDEAVQVVKKVIMTAQNRTITSPVLQSLNLDENGAVQLNISYIVVL